LSPVSGLAAEEKQMQLVCRESDSAGGWAILGAQEKRHHLTKRRATAFAGAKMSDSTPPPGPTGLQDRQDSPPPAAAYRRDRPRPSEHRQRAAREEPGGRRNWATNLSLQICHCKLVISGRRGKSVRDLHHPFFNLQFAMTNLQ
jgi:hypothetical protein